MQEFTTVSSSSYDPAALATKLNDKSADGWSVVSIVSTGGDVTAFLSRESSGQPAAEPESYEPIADPVATSTSEFEPAPTPAYEPSPAPEPTVAEPAGWAVAPEPSPASSAGPSTVYTPTTTTTTHTPAPAAPTPAPAAVPAGWYSDPAERFELRYWDGVAWTEHVARAGQQFTDPPVA